MCNAVESVTSTFRLEEVAVGFSEMLIPFKLHDVTFPENGKTEVCRKLRRNRTHTVTITNRYCNSFLMVSYIHDKTSVVPTYYSVCFVLQLYTDLEICVFCLSGPDHDQQHCCQHAPTVNQRLLLELL